MNFANAVACWLITIKREANLVYARCRIVTVRLCNADDLDSIVFGSS